MMPHNRNTAKVRLDFTGNYKVSYKKTDLEMIRLHQKNRCVKKMLSQNTDNNEKP